MSFSAGSAHGFSFVRRATEADHAALAELFLTTRRHAFPWVPPGEFQLSDFTLQTEGEIIHLAGDRQGRPLGFISVWQPTGFIHHLFVHPDYHRQGIGKRLLGSLQDWLPQPWRLKCQTANRAALAFYQHLGWHEVLRESDPHGEYALMRFPAPGQQITTTGKPADPRPEIGAK